MRKFNLLLTVLFVISSFLFGCSTKEEVALENKQDVTLEMDSETTLKQISIYTTIFPLVDFANKIGGDHVSVVNIYPPGADAHTFEPSAKTMVDIANADAFIYTGAGIEGFAEAAIEALKSEPVSIVKAGEGINLVKLDDHVNEDGHDEHVDGDSHDEHDHADSDGHDEHTAETETDEHAHGDFDPHIWLDPMLSIQMADNILQLLIQKKPEAKEEFEQNFSQLKLELEKLDEEFKEVINNATRNEIIVAHAAYGYWESRYGLEQISITGLSPTNEPSQKELMAIIETAKEHSIKYVIFEQNVSTKIVDIVRNEIKAEALTLTNLEAISEEDANNNEDYFSMMRRNLETLKIALN